MTDIRNVIVPSAPELACFLVQAAR